MNTFFTRMMILMVVLSTPAYLMAAGVVEQDVEQEAVQVFKPKKAYEHTKTQLGVGYSLPAYGVALSVAFKVNDELALQLSSGLGIFFSVEADAKYYPKALSWKHFRLYGSGGVMYFEPVLLNELVDVFVEAFTGVDPDTNIQTIGPSAKLGFDVPFWHMVLNVEGGANVATEVHTGLVQVLPIVSAGLKIRF